MGFSLYALLFIAFFVITADSCSRTVSGSGIWLDASSPAFCLAATTQCLWNLSHRAGWYAAAVTLCLASAAAAFCSNYLSIGVTTAIYFSLLYSVRPQLTVFQVLFIWTGCASVLFLAYGSNPHPVSSDSYALFAALCLQPLLLVMSNASIRFGRFMVILAAAR